MLSADERAALAPLQPRVPRANRARIGGGRGEQRDRGPRRRDAAHGRYVAAVVPYPATGVALRCAEALTGAHARRRGRRRAPADGPRHEAHRGRHLERADVRGGDGHQRVGRAALRVALRRAAAPHQVVHPLDRSLIRRKGARHRRPLSQPAGSRARAVRRRDEPVQVLERAQPLLSMRLGDVEGVTNGYRRHETTTRLAALEIATSEVLSRRNTRHRHHGFLASLHADVQLVAEPGRAVVRPPERAGNHARFLSHHAGAGVADPDVRRPPLHPLTPVRVDGDGRIDPREDRPTSATYLWDTTQVRSLAPLTGAGRAVDHTSSRGVCAPAGRAARRGRRSRCDTVRARPAAPCRRCRMHQPVRCHPR